MLSTPITSRIIACSWVRIFNSDSWQKGHFQSMSSTVAYSDKMLNDKFDGTVGFAIDGGIKDSMFVYP